MSSPCFNYSLHHHRCLIRGCFLSEIMQPGISERRDDCEKKERAATSQREVRGRSSPQKCDEHDQAAQPVIHSLELTETIGSTWVPPSGGVGERQCMTNLLPWTSCRCCWQLIPTNRKGHEKHAGLRIEPTPVVYEYVGIRWSVRTKCGDIL